jgi:hypothetical protein
MGALAPVRPALDRPRPDAAVSARRASGPMGRVPAMSEGHAAVTPTDPRPSRYLMRPQLLTRR